MCSTACKSTIDAEMAWRPKKNQNRRTSEECFVNITLEYNVGKVKGREKPS